MKRETNAQRRKRLAKDRRPKAFPMMPNPKMPNPKVFGSGLGRRLARRRERLGLTAIVDHIDCLRHNLGKVGLLHWAHEQGFREGHLAGYDNAMSRGQAADDTAYAQGQQDALKAMRDMAAEVE